MNYFKVYKRISVRKICIEIDQLPMESATSRTTSFPPPSPHIFARYSRVKTEKFTISKKQGSYFGNRILFILVHIYLDFLKTSYASNYFWDSEYFWDIFIRYFLNFFYGPPLE